MNRKTALKAILSTAALPTLASTRQSADLAAFKSEFVAAWKRSLDYTMAIFNQMPEAKLDYKYTPDAFSFRTQFVHCINFTSGQLSGRLGISDPYEKPVAWGKLSKAELATEIKNFYAWVETAVQQTPTAKLLEKDNFAGDDIPKWRLFYALENHIIHHRGQAICYLRLCGITPEGYIGW
jgi:uncharacterized damage-inducible protein DinB